MVDTEPKSKAVHVLRGGQVTIPIEFRRELGLAEGSLLEATLTDDGRLTLRPVVASPVADNKWMQKLYEVFEPVRREIRESGISEEELDALIDESVEEARARRYLKYQGSDPNADELAL
jgi:AbrB family looped-hinge helix DNA binding protein